MFETTTLAALPSAIADTDVIMILRPGGVAPYATTYAALKAALGVASSGLTAGSFSTFFASLPTTAPTGSKQPWNNGGTLDFTP